MSAQRVSVLTSTPRTDPQAGGSTASDILIVGGGIAGTVAALALADGRRRIVILEAGGCQGPRFGGEFVQPLGVDLLQRIGALRRLFASGAVSVEGFVIYGDPSGSHQVSVRLPYAEIGRHGGVDHAKGLALHCNLLVEALRKEATARKNIWFRPFTRVASLLWEKKRITGVRDASGVNWLAPLTLIAQGRHAPLRIALGRSEKPRPISLSVGVTVPGDCLPIRGYAHIFLGTGGDSSGPVIALPLAPECIRVSIDLPAHTDRASLATRIFTRHVDGLPLELTAALRDSLRREQFDVRVNCAFQTTRCAWPGLVLIGDAAGCTHPVTGTGMTTCLVDAWTLSEELRDIDFDNLRLRNGTKSLDAALACYQSRRYRFARPREVLADTLYEVFCGSDDATRAIRRALQLYWRASRRARSVSLKLLAGDSSSSKELCIEYLRISLRSFVDILRCPAASPHFLERFLELAGPLFGILRRFLRNFYRCTFLARLRFAPGHRPSRRPQST
jgi:squalene monooxygenase